ncbi:AraC family two component transcriptional regulator [Scopulibacillus darangshiensis]|uniref:AraC family two component transcriptional regulator n=1 Tax=Scopulibacillus darangshiensis TaxID=442528 RepID=A0A4R2P9Z4_9BACL|nr:helix-turn-helix domain-containing protein [Scopulibacillus darangshiensis]TCP31757.1 AraC family two component transcriptional regulator [Scopulibacillus darangshiensis]
MYKILIADDEEIERKALYKMIKENLSDQAVVVGEADNGHRAMELAMTHLPDIVLLDIKMPGMDGIAALREMKSRGSKAKFIMISAFDTFDYARNVMKEGVKEYLLKPARINETVETILRVINEIESEQQTLQAQTDLHNRFNKTLSFVQSEWVTTLLLNHTQEINIAELGPAIDVHLANSYAVVFELDDSAGDKISRYRWLKRTMKELCNGLTGPLSGMQIPVFIPVETEAGALAVAGLMEKVNRMFSEAFQSGSIRSGVGRVAYDVTHFLRSHQEALTALGHTNINRRTILFEPGMDKEIRETDTLYHSEQRLIDAIKLGTFEQVPKAFEHYFKHLNMMAEGNVEVMRKNIKELFIIVTAVSKELGISLLKPSILRGAETPIELREQGRAELYKVIDQLSAWRRHGALGQMSEAKKYINTNYASPMALEDIASRVGISPYYFSKLFKEHFSITFIDYVTSVRIKRAKELLCYTRLSLKEIAYQVGYKDPNYFSRVFKKNEGMSPKEYRTQKQKNYS